MLLKVKIGAPSDYPHLKESSVKIEPGKDHSLAIGAFSVVAGVTIL